MGVDDAEARRTEVADAANLLLDRVRAICLREASSGARELKVDGVLQEAGLELPPGRLELAGIPQRLTIEPSRAWQDWFPWRELHTLYWSLKDPGSLAARMRVVAPDGNSESDWEEDGDEMLVMP